jgi:hypothetical protein
MFIFFASNEGTTEDGFIYSDEMQMFNAKQCALIAVDEMLGLGAIVGSDLSDSFYIYWEEVKQEIKNL